MRWRGSCEYTFLLSIDFYQVLTEKGMIYSIKRALSIIYWFLLVLDLTVAFIQIVTLSIIYWFLRQLTESEIMSLLQLKLSIIYWFLQGIKERHSFLLKKRSFYYLLIFTTKDFESLKNLLGLTFYYLLIFTWVRMKL